VPSVKVSRKAFATRVESHDIAVTMVIIVASMAESRWPRGLQAIGKGAIFAILAVPVKLKGMYGTGFMPLHPAWILQSG
jgi:hypothetical protein